MAIGHDYKRSSARKSLQTRVFITSEKPGRIEAKATDLSTTGLCIYSENKLKVQQVYRLAIEMKVRGKMRIINALAETVTCTYSRIGCFKIGMRFLEVDGGGESIMLEYMENW